MDRSQTGFRAIAILITSIVLFSIGSLIYGASALDVSLRDIASSDTVPLGILALYRSVCAAAALYTLSIIYLDKRGLEMRYLGATIVLLQFRRFTTFTVWCFTLLFVYFAFATGCSLASLTGYGEAVPAGVVMATLVLFEISYPMSLLVTTVVSFVLFPAAVKNNYPFVARMFRFRPQMMHNGNVIMMQLAMLTAPPPVTLSHLPYTALFGCAYAIFSWVWFHRTGLFYYFFLDYRRPYAIFSYVGLFATLLAFYDSVTSLPRWLVKKPGVGGLTHALC